ncbi:MAG: hypothetical protein KJ052_10365 [Candidatus Hydrogenedentes bacterium]|nr:hypothetical protein [Candidatus Hydrogenedentota bacterium]
MLHELRFRGAAMDFYPHFRVDMHLHQTIGIEDLLNLRDNFRARRFMNQGLELRSIGWLQGASQKTERLGNTQRLGHERLRFYIINRV